MPDVTITVNDDGPYMVEGPCRVVDAEGNAWEVPGGKTWLCRCGSSSSKPFCDGSHRKVAFSGSDRAEP